MNEVTDTSQATPQNVSSDQPVSPVSAPTKKRRRKLLLILLVCIIVLAGVAYMFNVSQKPLPETQQKATQIAQPLFLTIEHPKNEDTAINGELLVAGKTLPYATVLIYTDTDETSVESYEQGAFEGTVLLGEEDSSVAITAFAENGDEKAVTLTVLPQSL